MNFLQPMPRREFFQRSQQNQPVALMNHAKEAITNVAKNTLNQATLSTDEVWAIEVNSRLTAFKAGQMMAIPAVQVLAKHLGLGIEKSGTENLELSLDAIQAIPRADREEPIGDYTFG